MQSFSLDELPSHYRMAAKEGYDKVVELLLHREDIEVNAADENKRTPLYNAAEMGHHEVVGLLLKREEIKVNQAQFQYFTPLHKAAQEGKTRVVELLLTRKDIEVDAFGEDGETTLPCS